jgi:glycogen phosphorylase
MNSPQNIRTGLTTEEIEQAFRDNLRCGMDRLEATATKHDLYFALALTVRDRLFGHSVESMEDYGGANARRVAYLSAEYCLGRTSRTTCSISASPRQRARPWEG